MAQDIIASTTKLPKHLATLGAPDDDIWSSGQTGGFPVISIKGKVFHIRRGDEVELVTKPDDEDEPASSLQIVVLHANPGVAKTYYKDKYEEGSDDAPTCYSSDGITPADDVQERQSKKCATCVQNQWGSRITDSGKKAKQCADVKRLAVAAAGAINDPMLLRVPPTSLKTWDRYVEMLDKKGLQPMHVITRISFDHNVSHQALLFKAVDFVTEDMVPQIAEILQDNILDNIVGSQAGAMPASEIDDEDADDKEETPPKPPAKQKAKQAPAKKKAAPKKEPEPEPEPEKAEESEEPAEETDDEWADLDLDDLEFEDD